MSTPGTAGTADPSSFLRGNFAPVGTELTVADLEVTGPIPSELSGRYVRTGPNPLPPYPANYHWFQGHGMVHGVRLEGGQAHWYRNRWVRSPAVSEALSEPPIPRDAGGWYDGGGNTNVVHHAGRVLALTEGSLPYELSPELGSVAAINFGGPLPGGFNAHPKFDPVSGEMRVVSYGFTPPFLNYHVLSADGHVAHSAGIDLGGPVMVHDLGFTATRLVLFDLPVVFSLEQAMAGTAIPFAWDPEYRARVGVMPRWGTDADVTWVDVEPCVLYHPLNGYDDGERIVLDVCVMARAFADPGDAFADEPPFLERWTIDPLAGHVDRRILDDRPQDFPRADSRLAGHPHRYGYAVGENQFLALGGLGPDPKTFLYKHDLVTGVDVEHRFDAGQIASEFVFVPGQDSEGEDEGYLIDYVWDAARDRSDLVIFDAHDFPRELARVHLPTRVPQGFHGNWIPDRALG